ncbi:MAG: transcriptional repressor [Alphaproteobacteria bacterium]|nr:transcriptional repressor [Alphaproteobacteria bacterium]
MRLPARLGDAGRRRAAPVLIGGRVTRPTGSAVGRGASARAAAAPHFPDPRHDHERCVSSALDRAARLCETRRQRLTSLRRHVLEIVWRGHQPIGAYTILETMQAELGKVVAPPTVYRALEFLCAQGLVHRVESLNAFVGCQDPATPHSVQLMICRACSTAVELRDEGVVAALSAAAANAGFAPTRSIVEVSGLCARCARSHGASPAPR